jgi:crotonobetainyl-CoA:carnitine CoA-transferase CaiB-like acyl-CoA transferase
MHDWVSRLGEADIPVAPVNTMAEAFEHPHVKARELLYRCRHPVEGEIPQLGFPVKFSATPARHRRAPPLLGEHNDELLAELGYTAEAIESFRRDAVI